ncbi:cyclin-dependent kinase inhibitor 1B-like [Arapaima gigas]
MSNVRLSNGSPPLERMDARLSDISKPSTCRVLFGVPDRQELQRGFREHMRDMEEASCAKWNFDFTADKPLPPGRYDWVKVDGSEVPDFYTKPHRTRDGPVDLNGNRSCAVQEGSSRAESPGDRRSESPSRDQSAVQRKRAASRANRGACSPAERSCQSKRANTGSDDGGSSEPGSGRSSPAEHTPRKCDPKEHTEL